MKRIFLSTVVMIFLYHFSSAQSAPYNVVFDVTSKDTLVHQMVIRWINEIMATNPEANIEVVFYAKSLDMVTKDKSVVSSDVTKYAARNNITFKVCEVAMKNNSVEKSQLLPGVKTVPDGIYEIISRQHDGWGYIKAAR
ncbi:MAG TPA: DsrE family protein [Saprospiraceae bacterium]|nr:DsrE family protein [Saprospiraceae bacterium]